MKRYAAIFFALTININTLSFFHENNLNNEQREIQKKYDATSEKYKRLQKKEENLKQKKHNKINFDRIEKLTDEIEDLKEEVIANFEELVELESAPEVRHKACLLLAEIKFNDKEYGRAKKYIDEILHIDAKDDIKKQYITYHAFARAHLRNSKIYKKLIEKEKNKDQKNWYYKKIAFHNNRAKVYFENIVKTKTLDEAHTMKIESKNITENEEKMIDCALAAGIYALKYIKKNNKAPKEKIEKYKNFAEQYLTEIIDYVNKKNEKKITTESLNNKIEALIKLADFYFDYKLEKNNAQKILDMLKEAKLLTEKKIKKLSKVYKNEDIDDSINHINIRIGKLQDYIKNSTKVI